MSEEQITSVQVDRKIAEAILSHEHNGNFSQRIDSENIFNVVGLVNVVSQTIGTAAGTYDAYFMAESSGNVIQIDFSGTDALAASNTNYITWSITNLGQAGAGSAALLAASDANTTKTTGGSAISANTKRTLTLTSTLNDLNLVTGDRIRIRVTVTGTLANTVTFPVYLIQTQIQ